MRKLSASRKGHIDRIDSISHSPLMRESTNPSFGPISFFANSSGGITILGTLFGGISA